MVTTQIRSSTINWKRVSEKLVCPVCGAKAFISPETDGTVGEHTHRFPISRQMAEELSNEDEDRKYLG